MAQVKKATKQKKTRHLNVETIGGYVTVHFGRRQGGKKMVVITVRIPRERLTKRLKGLEK